MTLTFAQVASLFTTPGLAAAGALAVSIPIAIHLLSKLRRRPQVWAAMRFVWEAYRKQKRRLQLEQMLLLAIRCLIVLTLGLALAGPVLTGCTEQFRTLGLVAGNTRTVHIVIDDGLSSRTADGLEDRTRFERLRALAVELIEDSPGSDRVVVWRSARPVTLVSDASSRSALVDAVEAMRPAYSKADVPGAVAEVARHIELETGPGVEHVVVLLSDWSNGVVESLGSSGVAAEALATLPLGVRVLTVEPAPPAGNGQIASLRARRQVVLASPGAGEDTVVPVEVQLRLFEDPTRENSTLRVALLDPVGREVGAAERRIAWPQGQSALTVNLDVPLPADAMRGAGGRRMLALRGEWSAAGGGAGDALPDDDARLAGMEVRDRWRVGVIDEDEGLAVEGLTPARWLTFALAPRSAETANIEPSLVTPAKLRSDDAALRSIDAAVVLRPDLLDEPSWSKLAAFAERGGVVWVFTPPTPSAAWTRGLRGAFQLSWTTAIEPVDVRGAADGAALDLDRRPPEVLSVLTTDWAALLRPVRVRRWAPLYVPAEDAWLRLNTSTPEAESSAAGALLAARGHGRGWLLLTSAALDAEWTNLPAKPLFVPLLHETLRGVLGARAQEIAAATAGEQVTLPESWPSQTGMLGRLPIETAAGTQAEARQRIAFDPNLKPVASEPGLFAAGDDTSRVLVVNVDADAGDTRGGNGATLAAWLDTLGPWQFLDPADPGAALQVEQRGPNVGWMLLWVLMALVLVETVLARTLSHAKNLHHQSLTALVLERVKRFHVVHHDEDDEERLAA